MNISDQIFTIFDTETTGFYPKDGDRITEIAAIKVQNGKAIDGAVFEALVNPEREIPFECVQISGITDDMVKDAPLISEVLPQFMEFAADTIWVAHNAIFDKGFVEEELFSFNPFGQMHDTIICTKELSKHVDPQEKFHSLDSIVYRYGLKQISDEKRHRALPDVYLLAEVFQTLLQKSSLTSVDDLTKVCTVK